MTLLAGRAQIGLGDLLGALRLAMASDLAAFCASPMLRCRRAEESRSRPLWSICAAR